MNINKEIIEHWAINGDKIKFKDLESASYDMIRGNLVLYAYGRTKDWMDAEDAVQEAYVHALTYPPEGDDHNFGGLYKLWLDQAISDIKKRKHNRSEAEVDSQSADPDREDIVEMTPSDDLIPEQALDLSGQADLVMDMSELLKIKEKHIVRLALIFGYSYKQIMSSLNVSHKKVDNTLTYFRKTVKADKRYEDLCR